LAVPGQILTIQLVVHATKPLELAATAAALKRGGGSFVNVTVSQGRYMPRRPDGTGAVWTQVEHFRPDLLFTVGPELCRPLLLECVIPLNARPGDYTTALSLQGGGEQLSLPIKVKIVDAKLAEIPIPVGLCTEGIPLGEHLLDSDTWWRLQEDTLRELGQAGMTLLSGGPGLRYEVSSESKITGDNAVRYVKLARKYATIRATVNYGGFLSLPSRLMPDFKRIAANLKAFENEHGLPPTFVNCYDEPSTETEMKRVLDPLKAATEAGFRTWGLTSTHTNNATWDDIVAATQDVAFNVFTPADIRKVKALGRNFWIYNQGLSRWAYGIQLWRAIQMGIDGRIDYIAYHTQGFAFHSLDGREPSHGCFMLHEKLGVLKTPNWVGVREGLLDCRLRLTLEKLAQKDDMVLARWSPENYRKDEARWSDGELNKVREEMLKRIEERTRK
jgi:hypothetical protein